MRSTHGQEHQEQAILDNHEDALDGLRTGRSWMKFKATKTLTLDRVRKLVG